MRNGIIRLVAVATGVVTIGLIGYTYRVHRELCSALRRGEGTVVEGTVSGFLPEGPDGHPREQFSVAGHDFEYSSSDGTTAFHWTAGQGGPIRNGLRVRITAIGDEIARLEIAQ